MTFASKPLGQTRDAFLPEICSHPVHRFQAARSNTWCLSTWDLLSPCSSLPSRSVKHVMPFYLRSALTLFIASKPLGQTRDAFLPEICSHPVHRFQAARSNTWCLSTWDLLSPCSSPLQPYSSSLPLRSHCPSVYIILSSQHMHIRYVLNLLPWTFLAITPFLWWQV